MFAGEILFFDVKSEVSASSNTLKNLLSFLFSQGIKRPARFSFVSTKGDFHKHLSIKENILLEGPQTGPSNANLREDDIDSTPTNAYSLMSYMQKNYPLSYSKLLALIPNLDEMPSTLDFRQRKIFSLLKALLQNPNFLILENPEEHLCPESLDLFKECLILYLKAGGAQEGRCVLIQSAKRPLWHETLTREVLVYQGHGNTTFQVIAKRDDLFAGAMGSSAHPLEAVEKDSSPVLNFHLHRTNKRPAA